MPAKSTTLTRPQIQAAKQLLTTLDLPQLRLADLVGIVQTTVSNLLRGKPIRTDTLERLVRQLAREVSQFAVTHPKSAAMGQIEDHLNCLRAAIGTLPPPDLLIPGGVLPGDHYSAVRRTAALDWLVRRSASQTLSVIVGLPRDGKSTAVGQFLHSLICKGRDFVYLSGRFGAELFRELAIEASRYAAMPPPESDDPATVTRWLIERSGMLHAIGAIVIDDFDQLPTDYQRTVIERLTFLKQHPRVTAHWTPMIILVGGIDLRIPGTTAVSERYVLPSFSQEEVVQLLTAYEVSPTEAQPLLHELGGEAWATHLAVDAMHHGATREAAVESARKTVQEAQ